MQNDDKEKIYALALKQWGLNSQIDMAIEEMAELMVELNHFKRGRLQADIGCLCEEIADVFIMMEQMKLIVGKGKVEEKVKEKLVRLSNSLERTREDNGNSGER